MEVVEFLNEFHVRIGFDRFKYRNLNAIKSIKYGNENQVARWNFDKKVWIIPISFKAQVLPIITQCRATHILIKENLPEKVDVIKPLPKLDFEIPLKQGKMRPYQEEGVARGLQLKRFINGDMPGLGKTLQAVATVVGAELHGNVTFPCLVICPSALKINWCREFDMWTNKKAMVLDDKNKSNWHRFWEIGNTDVFVVNYESLKKYFVTHMPEKKDLKFAKDITMDSRISLFKSVIIDESHRLKNPASITAKIVLNITKSKEYIICLTGTPVVNKPVDLWSQLAVIFQLNKFGGPDGYKMRYCEGGSGKSNLKELNYLLNENCFFRRAKEDVLKDLPPKSRQIINNQLSNQKEYDLVNNEFKKFLEENQNLEDKEIKKKIRYETLVKIPLLLKISAKGKIEEAKEFINEIIESGQKIVIFVMHTEIVRLLQEEFPKAVRVTGMDSAEQKQHSVDSFQKNAHTNIIICNHKAAGVGLTLTASSEVLFLELPWTDADREQCEARCDRMGQKNPVRCTYMLSEGTLDNWLYELIETKKQIANEVTGSEDNVTVDFVSSLSKFLK